MITVQVLKCGQNLPDYRHHTLYTYAFPNTVSHLLETGPINLLGMFCLPCIGETAK